MATKRRNSASAKKRSQKRRAPAVRATPDPALTSLIEIASTWYYWEQDADYRFTHVAGSLFKNAGIDPNIYIGKTRWELGIVPMGDDANWENHKKTLAAHEPFADLLFRSVNASGRHRYVSTTGHPIFDRRGRFRGYRGISHDITAEITAERRLQIERGVARVLADAESMDEAMPRVIEAVCNGAEFRCGAYWELSEDAERLCCRYTWGPSSAPFQDLLGITRHMSPLPLDANVCIVRAWQARQPVSIHDVREDAAFLRRPAAAGAGLRSWFAFPITRDKGTTAILEFFGGEPFWADQDLHEAVGYAGDAISQFRVRKKAEEELRRFRATMDASPDSIYVLDRATMRFIDFNAVACARTGFTREELLQRGPQDLFAGDRAEIEQRMDNVIANYPDSLRTEVSASARDGRRTVVELHQRALRSEGRWLILTISRDIHERKRAERANARLARMYATLSATNEAMLRATSPDALYERICHAAVSSGQFVTAAVLIADPVTSAARVAAVAGISQEHLRAAYISVDASIPEGRGLVGTSFRALTTAVANDLLADNRTRPWHDICRAAGWASNAAVPLVRHGRAIGVLFLLSNDRKAFDHEIVKLLERMAEDMAYALDNLDREAERQRAEEALRASEEKYRTILETMNDGYFEVDLAGNYTFFNEALRQMHGYSHDELMGLNYRKYMDAEAARTVYEFYNQVYRTREPGRLKSGEIIRKDGTRIMWESNVQLKLDAAGKPVGFRGVHRDVTQRREAEEALRASEERYRTILESIEDAYYEVDLKGCLVFFNNAFCRLLGHDAEQMRGMDYRLFTRPEVAARVYAQFNQVYRTGEPTRAYDWEMIHRDGTPLFGEGSVHLVRDARGEPIGFRGILRDVTRRRREEQILALEHAITRRISEADSERNTLRDIIRIICESERCTAGGFWVLDEEANVFRIVVTWRSPNSSEKAKNHYEHEQVVSLPAGGRLGEVWNTGKPLWIRDLDADSSTVWGERARKTGEPSSFLFPVMAEGTPLGVLAFISPTLRDVDERLLRATTVIGNQVGQFMRRKRTERVLRESESRFRALTELTSDWYWEQDAELRFTRFEGRLVTEHPELFAALKNRKIQEVLEAEGDALAQLHTQQAARQAFRDLVVWHTHEGQRHYFSASGEPVLHPDGRFLGYRGVGRDITIQKVAEQRIKYLATHDPLTGLPNRAMVNHTLTVALEAARKSGHMLAVLFVDLDGFKTINDTLGHEAGDHLLQEVAARLKHTLRGDDVVARLGGDEFIVLIQNANERAQIVAIARKLLLAVGGCVRISGQECAVTASIGISLFPADAQDGPGLMKSADRAMYAAKEQGKNNFRFCSDAPAAPSGEKTPPIARETSDDTQR